MSKMALKTQTVLLMIIGNMAHRFIEIILNSRSGKAAAVTRLFLYQLCNPIFFYKASVETVNCVNIHTEVLRETRRRWQQQVPDTKRQTSLE